MFKIKNLPSYGLANLTKKFLEVSQQHVENIDLPKAIHEQVFTKAFFDSPYYLIYPAFFNKSFGIPRGSFVKQLSTSGYLYYRYLLVLDAIADGDTSSFHENNTGKDILLLRTHIYLDEAFKILSNLFGKNQFFWPLWDKRKNEFLTSLLIDKKYNPDLSLQEYEMLATGKCAYSKVVVDALHSKKPDEKLHQSLLEAFDMFSVALCLQDDYEDFKKDLHHKKNNFAHALLKKWIDDEDEGDFYSKAPFLLFKEFHSSGVAEDHMELIISYHNKALEAIAPYTDTLALFTAFVKSYRNRCILMKAQMRADRISKFVYNVELTKDKKKLDLDEAIHKAYEYLENRQSSEGAWYEVSNKQGLSDVWSTGFISMTLPGGSKMIEKSRDYLLNHKSKDLWGYNVDWTGDYDSTTTVLSTLNKCGVDIQNHVSPWLNGQRENGGFSTYSADDSEIIDLLGFKNMNQIRGWTNDHICVSALAYQFLSELPDSKHYQSSKEALKEYLLARRSNSGIWQPYWWTSYIYPTYYIVQALLKEGNPHTDQLIFDALRTISKRQNEDGSFSCDMLNEKSVFYTCMALDLFSSRKDIFQSFESEANEAQHWVLENQFGDGSFAKSNFLVIPPTNVTNRDSFKDYAINMRGGTSAITGEVEGLFSSAFAARSLSNFKTIRS